MSFHRWKYRIVVDLELLFHFFDKAKECVSITVCSNFVEAEVEAINNSNEGDIDKLITIADWFEQEYRDTAAPQNSLTPSGTSKGGSEVDDYGVIAVDNEDGGFSTSGAWTGSASGYLGHHEEATNVGTKTATWTFTDLPAERYTVGGTWTGSTSLAKDAPFEVFDGTTSLGTIDMDQETSPNDESFKGVNWERIGDTFCHATLATAA